MRRLKRRSSPYTAINWYGYVLSGGAVGTSLHGNWTVGKSGLHTLLHLSVDKKNEGDGLFGVRFRKTLASEG